MAQNIKHRGPRKPRVSVIMSVYNDADYLPDAVSSILQQTFTSFEFIIIDDGSTDKSLAAIKKFNDKRIKLIARENRGLTFSLNQGLKLARGEYVARMDADDISVPTRLEKEVAFLDANPDIGLVGSHYTIIDSGGKTLDTKSFFTEPDDLKLALVTCNQFGHGSVMFRRDLIKRTGSYDADVGFVEDYDLWTRISHVTKVANLDEALYAWRYAEDSISNNNRDLQAHQTFIVRDEAFDNFLQHRQAYRLIFHRPSGLQYYRRKAIVYRNLAYLYRSRDHILMSLLVLGLAIAYQPLDLRSYKYLLVVFYRPWLRRWGYEFL